MMMRRGNRPILTAFLVLVFISFIFSVFDTLFPIAIAAVWIAGIVAIARAIMKVTGNNKKNNNKTASAREEEKILKNLIKYFQEYDRLYFDDETYIEPEKNKEISYETLNIFIDGEYISTMADYKDTFPSSYSKFLKLIGDYVKKGRFTKAKKETNKKSVSEQENLKTTTTSEAKQAEEKKGAQYYIEKLNELNNKIDNEEVSKYLNETVIYLDQIKKIEGPFPSSKSKTTKLYQY